MDSSASIEFDEFYLLISCFLAFKVFQSINQSWGLPIFGEHVRAFSQVFIIVIVAIVIEALTR